MKELTYLSLGAGVQSSALLLASDRGLWGVPRADVAIFADTQDEPAWVYEYLKVLEQSVSIPIHRVTRGRLSEAGPSFLRIPAFTRSADGRAGLTRRQCTSEYKLAPIIREVRRLLGQPHPMRVTGTATGLIGISLDEAHRMKPALRRFMRNSYPLVDARKRRGDCLALIRELGLPTPKKSACVFCPYHDDATWRDLKANHPIEWKSAVEYDARIRNSTQAGTKRPAFLHRSLVPLGEADLKESSEVQPDMFGNECEGVCGI